MEALNAHRVRVAARRQLGTARSMARRLSPPPAIMPEAIGIWLAQSVRPFATAALTAARSSATSGLLLPGEMSSFGRCQRQFSVEGWRPRAARQLLQFADTCSNSLATRMGPPNPGPHERLDPLGGPSAPSKWWGAPTSACPCGEGNLPRCSAPPGQHRRRMVNFWLTMLGGVSGVGAAGLYAWGTAGVRP